MKQETIDKLLAIANKVLESAEAPRATAAKALAAGVKELAAEVERLRYRDRDMKQSIESLKYSRTKQREYIARMRPVVDAAVAESAMCDCGGPEDADERCARCEAVADYQQHDSAEPPKPTLVCRELKLSDGDDSPFPVRRCLEILADAAEHLLTDHDCDGHGHEVIHYAAQAARKLLAAEKAKHDSAEPRQCGTCRHLPRNFWCHTGGRNVLLNDALACDDYQPRGDK